MRSMICRPMPPEYLRMLLRSHELLRQAAVADSVAERFLLAHLSALRTAAAVSAARARPDRRRRPTSAWVLVRSLAPDLGEWAEFFAATAAQRAAVEAGAPNAVAAQDADRQVRAAREFLGAAEDLLGLLQHQLAG